MPRILVADKISDAGVEILKEAGLEVDVKTGLPEAELVGIIAEYDGVIVRSATKITRPIIEAGGRLRLIGRAGVGVDNIDRQAATERGVIVMNTPLGNITSAAEHALALMFSCARNVAAADKSMKAGEWDKKSFTGVELGGKTLGIVGLGKIGGIVARVGKALSMRVLACDPFLNPEKAAELDIEQSDIDRLLAESDFVTLHVPLNDSTRGMIGGPQLARMKKTARLVNCSRGGVVDEAALAEALESGEIAGAALDVFSEEPLPADSPLRKVPRLLLTPHLGASTAEAQEKVAEDLARQFVEYFVRGDIQNPVNLSVTLESHLVPFANLAELLGKFVSQTVTGGLSEVEVGVYGELGTSASDAHVLAVCALQGVLGNRVDEFVNLVNVGLIAKSRGIDLKERRGDTAPTYHNVVVVRVRGEDGERSVTGTIFDGNEARIVEIDDFAIDVRPAPWMLVMRYADRPGIIGKIGSLLGEGNINIAAMSLGRREKRGQAVVALTIDEPAPETLVKKIVTSVDADVRRIQI